MSTDDNKIAGRISTPFKMLVAIALALLPIGGLIIWNAVAEFNDSRQALRGQAQAEMFAAARSAETLIARNTLALRVAAYGAVAAGEANPCMAAREALSVAPAVARDFVISDADGNEICGDLPTVPPPNGVADARDPIALWVDPANDGIVLQVAVPGATATGRIQRQEILEAVAADGTSIDEFSIGDGERRLAVASAEPTRRPGIATEQLNVPIAGQRLEMNAATSYQDFTNRDRLSFVLPVIMWAFAALLSWVLVHFLLIRPLRRLNHAVREYDVDTDDFALPERLGPAREIHELGNSFMAAVGRMEESEDELRTAIDNQKKLVREVHHRVKNNLQVVASLLNIHSRGVEGEEAKAAYTGIGRRVEALAVVHRNHFAEIEESRGIQLRPLLTELAAGLRASASNAGHAFDLDLDAAATTQDAAVSAAFFVTEVVEHALLSGGDAAIEIGLRRTSELTARLSVASADLVSGEDAPPQQAQFERIVEGLSRQLRSPLDKKLGNYSVEIPVFPEKSSD
ncbi:sensor histidine kinase [Sphingomicrobium sediminis]|uniref:histidine kinase n=1 Tax=Sphingomicrobium sediminis TaxID=2950949 RepID=A0A9X2J3Q2_9SPHN|nr:histidine kinase dimerization/phosphoacceptor domain -containing protein [Sphingomicrobium sediminis]MCM8557546.1 hypothetical protein [Sphingomicrobium sediminis]